MARVLLLISFGYLNSVKKDVCFGGSKGAIECLSEKMGLFKSIQDSIFYIDLAILQASITPLLTAIEAITFLNTIQMAKRNQQQYLGPSLPPTNPPAANDTPPLPYFPSTATYFIKTLNHQYAMPNVRPDEIYFFAPNTIGIGFTFHKTNWTFAARVENMKVGDWHKLLCPGNPQNPKPPLILAWFHNNVLKGRLLVEGNDVWDELLVGLGWEILPNEVARNVTVLDA